MNEKTKERLESEINVPAPTQPVDKLRIAESPAAASHARPHAFSICYLMCFADDE